MGHRLPIIIQGGMGVAVSNWRLAHAVATAGQMGVVSGTAIDAVMVRRLQLGDIGGHVRRALEAFPFPEVAARILDRYFVPGGKPDHARFKARPMPSEKMSRWLQDLLVSSNFVEVFLAKENHGGLIGINFLEKLQIPTLASLYGAMLAKVDYVLMGAGIPRAIPGALDRLASGLRTRLGFDVKGNRTADAETEFDPVEYGEGVVPDLKRPAFLAIVSSHVLATMLARRTEGRADGFVVEAPTAGGHNAPPRGKLTLNDRGEPIYGERDEPDFEAMRELGLPFWLAGMRAEPDAIAEARGLGAAGVQVGTAFAYCEESGFTPEVKRKVLELSRAGKARVHTDPRASPTGFPFKVVQVEDTLAEEDVYEQRARVCDLGYLRSAYEREDGSIGWRCASEPVADYVRKGGAPEDTVGRKCLCNALLAAVGMGQVKFDRTREPVLITSGDDVANVARFLPEGAHSYTAADVIRYLLREPG